MIDLCRNNKHSYSDRDGVHPNPVVGKTGFDEVPGKSIINGSVADPIKVRDMSVVWYMFY